MTGPDPIWDCFMNHFPDGEYSAAKSETHNHEMYDPWVPVAQPMDHHAPLLIQLNTTVSCLPANDKTLGLGPVHGVSVCLHPACVLIQSPPPHPSLLVISTSACCSSGGHEACSQIYTWSCRGAPAKLHPTGSVYEGSVCIHACVWMRGETLVHSPDKHINQRELTDKKRGEPA